MKSLKLLKSPAPTTLRKLYPTCFFIMKNDREDRAEKNLRAAPVFEGNKSIRFVRVHKERRINRGWND